VFIIPFVLFSISTSFADSGDPITDIPGANPGDCYSDCDKDMNGELDWEPGGITGPIVTVPIPTPTPSPTPTPKPRKQWCHLGPRAILCPTCFAEVMKLWYSWLPGCGGVANSAISAKY